MKGIFAALAIWVGATIPALAQDAGRLPLVGVMVTGSAVNATATTQFREALAALGDVEGRNLRLDFRFTDGDTKRFPEMAEAFVKQQKASVIVVFSQPGARAAQRATRTIPIIAVTGDFVAEGFGASLAKPDGNITGISWRCSNSRAASNCARRRWLTNRR
jgi:putative ABC transport system substrate-binding protein